MKGTVYKITFKDKIYVGSTEQKLKYRINNHGAFKLYGMIKSESKVEILEEMEFENKIELKKKEQEWMDKYDCINCLKAFADGSNKKEKDENYYQLNKEKIIERVLNNTDKEVKKDYDRQRYQLKRAKVKANSAKNYYANHEKKKKEKRDKYHYVCSWGGNPIFSCNLLSISL